MFCGVCVSVCVCFNLNTQFIKELVLYHSPAFSFKLSGSLDFDCDFCFLMSFKNMICLHILGKVLSRGSAILKLWSCIFIRTHNIAFVHPGSVAQNCFSITEYWGISSFLKNLHSHNNINFLSIFRRFLPHPYPWNHLKVKLEEKTFNIKTGVGY